MSREDVGNAINAMADESVRAQIEAGDLSALGDTSLTDDERAVVIDAARDFPEVSGFAMPIGQINFAAAPGAFNFAANGRFGEASHYAFGKLAGPNIAGHTM